MAVRVSGPSFLAFLTYYSLLFPFQIALPQLLEAEAAKRNPDDQVTVNITDNNLAAEERAQELANNHFSIFINQDRRPRASLPDWCKPVPNRKLGPWHLLADDEYSNESPYLLCGLPETFPRTAGLQRVSRKTAHAKGSTRGRACHDVLQIPKVAMMFLTQGPMPHEALWARWLSAAADLVPTLCLANAVCARGGLQALRNVTQACGEQALQGKSIYERQLLFSAYIHAPPEYPLRNESSVFYGRDSLVTRLHSAWADHSTVEAMRRMLSAALKDRTNQRFILLSESCIPLYSPVIVYQQLMHEKRSRISACAVPGWDRSIERYNIRMAAGRRPYGRVPADKWRKHMHWFSLTRFHAELVSNDTEIVETFARDCFVGYDVLCTDPSKYRFCLADEHYVSTLLAVYGLDAQTDCLGKLTHADFNKEDGHPEHPKQYMLDDINVSLIRDLRVAKTEVEAASEFARHSFHKIEEYPGNSSIWRIPYTNIRHLAPTFHLFARKFGPDTANALIDLFESNNENEAKLGIFSAYQDSKQPKMPETNFGMLMNSQIRL